MGQCLASDTSAEDVKVPKRKKQPNGASNMKNSVNFDAISLEHM